MRPRAQHASFTLVLHRAVIAVYFCVGCMQVSLMSRSTVCAADQLIQHGFGDAHASACFSYNRLGSGLLAGFSLFIQTMQTTQTDIR